MKIQKGIVKYKDRHDIVCTYGVADNGTQYYFLDENDEKKMSNGNRIVSTALVEAVDPMVKATHIGVIDKDGNVVIPCENKVIKPIDDNTIIVEKAFPTSQSVLDAIEKRNDTAVAPTLVSSSATIKDKMNAKMGPEGRFLVNDQFSEATICDISGKNLVNDEVYSYIGIANNELYLNKNVPEADTVEFSLETRTFKEEAKGNDVIDVGNTVVDSQAVETALQDEKVEDKEPAKELTKTDSNAFAPLDLGDFFKGEGGPVPSEEEVKKDDVVTPPLVDSKTVEETVNENKPIDIGNPQEGFLNNNTENQYGPISPLDMPPMVSAEDEEKVVEETTENHNTDNKEEAVPEAKENKVDDGFLIPPTVNVDDVIKEDNKVESTEAKEEAVPEVKEETAPEVKTEEEPVQNTPPVDPIGLARLDDDDVEETTEVKEEKVEEVQEEVKEEVKDEPVSEVKEEKVEENIPEEVEEEPVQFSENVTSIDSKEVASTVDKDNNGILDSEDIIHSRHTSKETKEDSRLFDDINDLPDLDDIDSIHSDSSNDSLMGDVARSMAELVKKNREQRHTISEIQGRLEESESQRRVLTERYKEQASRYEKVANKLRSLDSLTTKLESKVKEQEKTIEAQNRKIKSLTTEQKGKKDLERILADARELLAEDDDYSEYRRIA